MENRALSWEEIKMLIGRPIYDSIDEEWLIIDSVEYPAITTRESFSTKRFRKNRYYLAETKTAE